MKYPRLLLALVVMMVSLAAFAQAPVQMLQQVSSQMIAQLDQNQGQINRHVVDGIIHRVLLPHVDLEAMSRSVVGKAYWTQATLAQREAFKNAFSTLLIKVYSAPLSSYNGETIDFKPMRAQNGSRVQVESVIARKNGQRIPVSYRLLQSGGGWKIYDFSVEGISLVSSYRAQFDTLLQQGGMAGLLDRLKGGR